MNGFTHFISPIQNQQAEPSSSGQVWHNDPCSLHKEGASSLERPFSALKNDNEQAVIDGHSVYH